jgi:hypothetical protein
MRRKLVEEFAVSYLNGALKPNLAEKNPVDGKDIEYFMDGPQFERTNRSEVWSFGNAVGSGYQYRVVYRDKRFSDLVRLLDIFSGAVLVPDGDRSGVERRLYDLILVLMREGRLPASFKIQSGRTSQDDRVRAMLEEFGRSLDDLAVRVKKLEEQQANRDVQTPPDRSGTLQ